jgi:hypothetical protein
MGFFLSVLYFVTYYLTPTTLFGPLAPFRIELIIAVIIAVVSMPAVQTSFLGKTAQSYALAGLGMATILSLTFGAHWFGGGVHAFFLFIPNAFAYFLVCLHCNTKKRLQVLVLMLLCVCMFVITRGVLELREGPPGVSIDPDTGTEIVETPPDSYQLAMRNDAGEWFFRLRGQGEINDPNDFAQVIICTVPLMFIFWRRKRAVRNFFLVLVPIGILLYGAFLTHSRGSVVALVAVMILAARRKIGTIWSALLGAGVYAAASVLHFTGGREISADAGQDRLDLWSAGIQLLKSHPLFGVGFNQMPDYAGLTAHNSVVVCAAELGMFGLYFWAMFIFPTIRDTLQIASRRKISEPELPVIKKPALPFARVEGTMEELDKSEINRLGYLMFLSLMGFLVAGWFLSRAYVMTLFLLGGMVEVIYEMAYRRGMVAHRWRVGRLLPYAAGCAVGLVLLMYVMLRISNLMR